MNARLLIGSVLGVSLLLSACKKEESKEANTEEVAKTPSDLAPETEGPQSKTNDAPATLVQHVMIPYEQCRQLLASDQSKGVADCANAMSEAATSGLDSAPEASKDHLRSLVTAAKTLAGLSVEDVEKLRVAYGEVSKSVVALLTVTPAAAKDFHVFECPMAKGYKRWAQPSKDMGNPYMGTKMLQCGSEVHDHHQGMRERQMIDSGSDDGHQH